MVVTSAPFACTAEQQQEAHCLTVGDTMQAPHTPCSQPRCVPRQAGAALADNQQHQARFDNVADVRRSAIGDAAAGRLLG